MKPTIDQPIPEDSELSKAIDELFSAWHKYRDFIKRNHRERLHGMMWAARGHEVIAYSENARYTKQLTSLFWNEDTDTFHRKED